MESRAKKDSFVRFRRSRSEGQKSNSMIDKEQLET